MLAAQEKFIGMLESDLEKSRREMWNQAIEESRSETCNQSKPDIPLMDSFTPAEAYLLVMKVSQCVLGDPLSDEN